MDKQQQEEVDGYNLAPKELKNLNEMEIVEPKGEDIVDEEETFEAKANNLVSSI